MLEIRVSMRRPIYLGFSNLWLNITKTSKTGMNATAKRDKKSNFHYINIDSFVVIIKVNYFSKILKMV